MTEEIAEDPVVASIIKQAVQALSPRRVILFGSRARGDASERADYDFAFEVDGLSDSAWARFSVEAEEKTKTLKKLDLVRLDQVDEGFRQRILREGVVVYERGK